MTPTIIIWLCMFAILASIFFNFKYGVNMGMLAMSFAFVIGCLINGQSVSKVFGYWPTSLIFFILASALFYGYATENGTVLNFGNKLLWLFRGHLKLLPWAVFFIAAIMAFLGAGTATIFFLSPIAYAMAKIINMNPIIMAAAVSWGYVVGTYNPWTGMGVNMTSMIMANGVGDSEALKIAVKIYAISILRQLILFGLAYVILVMVMRPKKIGESVGEVEIIKKPEPFDPVQSKTFTLIILSFVLILVPSVIRTFFKIDSVVFRHITAFCQPQSLMIIFALVASLMNLASTKKVIDKLPMNTVLLIAGVSFLMSIAQSSGLNDIVIGAFEDNVWSPAMVTVIVTMIAGFISLFSSTWSVVMPMMYPMVPALAAATGVEALVLYTAVIMGSSCTTVCPFSTAGAQQVALCEDDQRDYVTKGLIVVAVAAYIINALLALVGLFDIFA